MRYRIRQVDVEDVSSLRRLFEGASGDVCLRLATSGETLVAEAADGEVVAVAGLAPGGVRDAAVFVAPGWRGVGLGRSLADAIGQLRAQDGRPAAMLGEVA
jgi:GNAT superfamily N-acetyltransferase